MPVHVLLPVFVASISICSFFFLNRDRIHDESSCRFHLISMSQTLMKMSWILTNASTVSGIPLPRLTVLIYTCMPQNEDSLPILVSVLLNFVIALLTELCFMFCRAYPGQADSPWRRVLWRRQRQWSWRWCTLKLPSLPSAYCWCCSVQESGGGNSSSIGIVESNARAREHSRRI
jgi:hypothetical protein